MWLSKRTELNAQTEQGENDKFSLWKARLEDANARWRDYYNSIKPYYLAYEGTFTNPYNGEKYNENDKYVGAPLAYAHVKFKIPLLFHKDPYIAVSARTPFTIENVKVTQVVPVEGGMPGQNQLQTVVRDNVIGAEALESAINYDIKRMKLKQNAKASIMDGLFCYGVVKLGYDSEETYDPTTAPVEAAVAEAEGEDDPRAGLGHDTTVVRGAAWAKRVSPWDFRYDLNINMLDNDLSQSRWVAFRKVRPLDAVKRDKIYKNTRGLQGTLVNDRETLRADKGPDTPATDRIPGDDGRRAFPTAVTEKFVELWEIWDKQDRMLYVIATGHQGFIREDPWPFDMRDFPLAFLWFNETPDTAFPVSDFKSWYQQNLVINICESMDIESMRRRMDKVFVRKGSMTSDEMENMTSALGKSVVEVADPNADVREFKSSSGEVQLSQVVRSRANDRTYELSGVSAQQKGVTEPEKTATETAIVQSNAEARNAESVDRVKDWIECIARKLVSLMKQFYTKERLVPVIGREDFEWMPFSSKNIQGEYDYNVRLSVFNPTRPEIQAKQITDMIALFMRMPQIPDGMGQTYNVNLVKLVEEWMRATNSQVKPREVLMGPTPPMMPSAPGGPQQSGQPEGQGQQPPAGGNAPPLPGEGSGANNRSPIASQGAGRAMMQAERQKAMATLGSGSMGGGAMTPARGA